MTDFVSHQPMSSTPRISRRTFLVGAGVIAAGSTLFAVHQTQLLGPDASLEELLNTLQRSTFATFVGDTFHLGLATTGQTALRLTKVRDLANGLTFSTEEQTRAYHKASFSILFEGPSDSPLAQGSYTAKHYRIGTFPLFIVPLQLQHNAYVYEATFNRLPT